MDAYRDGLAKEQHRLVMMDVWSALYDDAERRRNRPSAYNEKLLRQTDEMDRLELVD